MKFLNKETNLALVIDVELLDRIAAQGASKYPNEFGGLLVGRYIDNERIVLIEDILLPKRYASSRYFFERGSEGLRQALELYYYAEPRLIYVGEWHTHPDNPAQPSARDIKSMQELASDKNVLINNPVLMILEITRSGFQVEMYVFYNNQLLRYEPITEQ